MAKRQKKTPREVYDVAINSLPEIKEIKELRDQYVDPEQKDPVLIMGIVGDVNSSHMVVYSNQSMIGMISFEGDRAIGSQAMSMQVAPEFLSQWMEVFHRNLYFLGVEKGYQLGSEEAGTDDTEGHRRDSTAGTEESEEEEGEEE